jgi:hypothetical protein
MVILWHGGHIALILQTSFSECVCCLLGVSLQMFCTLVEEHHILFLLFCFKDFSHRHFIFVWVLSSPSLCWGLCLYLYVHAYIQSDENWCFYVYMSSCFMHMNIIFMYIMIISFQLSDTIFESRFVFTVGFPRAP